MQSLVLIECQSQKLLAYYKTYSACSRGNTTSEHTAIFPDPCKVLTSNFAQAFLFTIAVIVQNLVLIACITPNLLSLQLALGQHLSDWCISSHFYIHQAGKGQYLLEIREFWGVYLPKYWNWAMKEACEIWVLLVRKN